jgi:putative peptidoglycan lipid II flippase
VSRRGSFFVATGILLSRMFGLARQRVLAHYVGQGDVADALSTAFRIPNFLQNLLGEGALSASFIPKYARLLGAGDEEEARRLAGALLALLMVVVSVLVLVGELATPWLMTLLVSKHGWTPEKRALTQTLVRILFPGTGMMVFSAWCLGVLNSHRKFLLSYASPVMWNVAIIGAALLVGRHRAPDRFVMVVAWGAVAGSLLQVLVQVPGVLAVGGRIVPVMWTHVPELASVMTAFLPNVISRGANQISALVDLRIATSMAAVHGAVAAMGNAQVLYLLPVSLFGMAVSAAELPEMARETGDMETVAKALRIRLTGATQRLAFYIVPSALGFLTLGGVIAAAIFRSRNGLFTQEDADLVWIVLAGSATGLLASTLGRLYASTFYALHDTRTPLYCGVVRVFLTGSLGWFAGLRLPGILGIDAKWGVAGLTATAGIAGWVEFALLRRELRRRVGRFSVQVGDLVKLWAAGSAAAAVGLVARHFASGLSPIPLALVAVPANAGCYLLITWLLDIPEASVLLGRIRRSMKGDL